MKTRLDSGRNSLKLKRTVNAMKHERTRNLVVRLDDQELEMARALAEDRDEHMTTVVRRLLKAAYLERFGVNPPKK